MNMDKLFTLINFLIFLTLSGIHFYWLLGGRWALNVAVPTDSNERYLFRPGRFATLVVAIGLLSFGLINLVFGQWIMLDIKLEHLHYAIIGIGVIFLLRVIGDFKYIGMGKRYRNTPFARKDNWIYTPLCLLLGLSHLYLIW